MAGVLFRDRQLAAIRAGELTVAFRRWKRPSVRAGGTLHTRAGLLRIDAVEPVEPGDVSEADVAAAGASTVDELLADLPVAPDRRLYRIRFHREGDDPRLALRDQDELSASDVDALRSRLAAWDGRSPSGPWTAAVLGLIEQHPARRAGDLAEMLGMERLAFKLRVRRLKSLGLTESLDVGYRLSPRGRAFVDAASGRPPSQIRDGSRPDP